MLRRILYYSVVVGWRSVLVASLVAVAGCREPTQITLELRSDAACGADAPQVETEIVSAAPEAMSERPVVAVTSRCPSGGVVGTLVVAPSGERDAEVSIEVVMALGTSVQELCKPPAYGDRCIVARRTLRYVPHTPLLLPIDLRLACLGEPCEPDETCVDGGCRDATIVDPGACADGEEGCNQGGLLPLEDVRPAWVVVAGDDQADVLSDVEPLGESAVVAGVISGAQLGGTPIGGNAHVIAELSAAGDLSGVEQLLVLAGAVYEPLVARATDGRTYVAATYDSVVTDGDGHNAMSSGVEAVYLAERSADGAGTGIVSIGGTNADEPVDLGDLALGDDDLPRLGIHAKGPFHTGPMVAGTMPGGYVVPFASPLLPAQPIRVGPGVDSVSGLAEASGKVVVTGVTISPASPAGIDVSFDSAPDGYVAALDSDSGSPWADSFTSPSAIVPTRVAAGPLAVYAVGSFSGAAVLAGTSVDGGDGSAGYVAAFAPSGEPRWLRVIRASGSVDVRGVTTGSGGVYVAGSFSGTLELGQGALEAVGEEDIFVAHFGVLHGGLRWVRVFGGPGHDAARAVAAHASGAVTVVGELSETVDFGPAGTVTAAGGTDAFALRLEPVP
jgi:hypothetical protein